MADQNHGSGIFFEECLKPLHSLDIEVVCRFIQDQQIRTCQDELCEREAGLLATRAVADGFVHVTWLEAKAA